MGARKPPSAAVIGLIDEVRAKSGLVVTDRQIERWRQAGALDLPDSSGLGRGRGSERPYPAGTADQVIELVGLLDKHRKIGLAILLLFLRGWPVPLHGLQRGYEWLFDHAEAQLRREIAKKDPEAAKGDLYTEEAAEAAGAALVDVTPRIRVGPVMRRNVARMPEREESVQSVLGSALSNLMSLMMLGEPLSDGGVEELAAAVGFVPMGQALDDMVEAASRMLLPAVRAAVENATRVELEMARDIGRMVDHWSRERTPARGKLDPVPDGIESGMRLFALTASLNGELAVAIHAALLLIFLPMTGETIAKAHADMLRIKEATPSSTSL